MFYGIKTIVCLFTAVMLLSCAPDPTITKLSPPAENRRPHMVYVVNHGWHTGIIVPAAELDYILPQLQERFPGTDYYEIGWGDQAFYQADEISTALALQALFLSRGTVVHVAAIVGSPLEYFIGHEILGTCISINNLDSLTAFLAENFAYDSEDKIIGIGQGIYGNSSFYKGAGRYSLLYTCNTWAAEGLRKAGVSISSWTTTSAGIMKVLRKQKQACTDILTEGT
ncbi:MAG: TIGR02117 family protein [Desulfopila sp.]|jgi:uncharacterized protein (TIGR02117 family)|nr:TIGR02117 family protein [Desulfopila sp.]